jgi:hypothetical protein
MQHKTVKLSARIVSKLPVLWQQHRVTVDLQSLFGLLCTTVPEIIDHVFAKTSQNARFLLSENERFGLVFVKTGSINSGTVLIG